jgi:hypothetical protein
MKHSIRALQSRGLAVARRSRGVWSAEITDGGRYFLEHGEYPVALQPLDELPVAAKDKAVPKPADFEVDSPAGVRARGGRPRGDALHRPDDPDPWDTRVLISVKEAAWLVSMNEAMIRLAVRQGDLQRVFIGKGTTNYRIVYGSLLAWVNDMPREPPGRGGWASW